MFLCILGSKDAIEFFYESGANQLRLITIKRDDKWVPSFLYKDWLENELLGRIKDRSWYIFEYPKYGAIKCIELIDLILERVRDERNETLMEMKNYLENF